MKKGLKINTLTLATWSQENGPAARHQILDDHWGSWNWRKVINSRMSPSFHAMLIDFHCSLIITGTNLQKTLQKAWKWSKAQREVANTLSASISEETVRRWQRMVADYKRDKSKPNPFEEREIGVSFPPCVQPHLMSSTAVSFASVRREFLQEESDAQKRGAIQLHKTTASAFLRQALDIEEKQ